MVFDDSVDESKGLQKKYADVWGEIKSKMKTINGGKENNYRKDYMKIQFNSDNDCKPYPQVFLEDTQHEL